jgi:hypothetical protein
MRRRVVEPRDVSRFVLADARHTHGHGIGQLGVEDAAQIDAVVRPVSRLERAGIVALRPYGIHLDGAADRVAPRERALRAAQDFHPFDVHEVEQRAGQCRQVDVVDVDADARLDREVGIVLADAADVGDETRRVFLVLRGQRDVGRLAGNLGDVRLAAPLEHVAGDGGDGQRRVLQVLPAELRGDDHLLERIGLRGLLCKQRTGKSNPQDCGNRLDQRLAARSSHLTPFSNESSVD